MKKHSENKDVKALISKGLKVVGMTINFPKNIVLGIKSWGRVDFLVNHRGYKVVKE